MTDGVATLMLPVGRRQSHQIVVPDGLLLQPAWAELLKAHEYAHLADCDIWEFAVDIDRLRALGLTDSDFRWLLRAGYVEQAQEVTRLEDEHRHFRPTQNLSLSKRTCFVLTERGAAAARAANNGKASGHKVAPPACEVREEPPSGKYVTPTWDSERHELRVDGLVVKHFKCPAANQEAILAAFQEEGWPPRIDDPLPPQAEQESKRRLNDTIKCLNKNQTHKLICFHGDGTGEGVLWSFAECDEAELSRLCEDCPLHATATAPHPSEAAPSADGSPRIP